MGLPKYRYNWVKVVIIMEIINSLLCFKKC
jgi:hypothetical protein